MRKILVNSIYKNIEYILNTLKRFNSMRKLIVQSFITLDGVIQAPGTLEEDTSGGFRFGGWTVPYSDKFGMEIMMKQMGHPFDLLLGRKTYDLFASHWPMHNDNPIGIGINKATKYVASHSKVKSNWDKMCSWMATL